jgi:transposase
MNLKDLCRLLLTTNLSNRQVGAAAGVSHNTAGRYRQRLSEEDIALPEIDLICEEALDRRLNDGRQRARKQFLEPDWKYVHEELRRVGVTLLLLYEEYGSSAESGLMSEREFRRRYERYRRSLGLVMRQPHRPGEQLFVDYSGKRPSITDPHTGKRTPVELFVAVLGAGRKTFVYATPTQRLGDWIEAHIRALEFFGGVPTFLVPDNLKSAVVSISRKDGHLINPTYQECARHYNTMVMPTRARKPKDKAAVEAGVLLAQRWILARLRNRTFYSLAELNAAIAELLQRLNDKPMRGYDGKTRNQLFEELDRPAMKPLPQLRYEYAEWKIGVTVAQDYHVAWDSHYYSVPYRLVAAKVNVKATQAVVEVIHREKVVATHLRRNAAGQCSTKREHQPQSHQRYAQDQAAELMTWAEAAGPSIKRFVELHIEKHRRPAVSLQACRGLKRLAREVGVERLELACHRAMRMNASSIHSVRSMLDRGIENTPLHGEPAANDSLPAHENVRGASSYE